MRLCSGPLILGSEVQLHMPEARFGGENGKTVHLEVDPELVAVRARRGRSLREGPVPRSGAAGRDGARTELPPSRGRSLPTPGTVVTFHGRNAAGIARVPSHAFCRPRVGG